MYPIADTLPYCVYVLLSLKDGAFYVGFRGCVGASWLGDESVILS